MDENNIGFFLLQNKLISTDLTHYFIFNSKITHFIHTIIKGLMAPLSEKFNKYKPKMLQCSRKVDKCYKQPSNEKMFNSTIDFNIGNLQYHSTHSFSKKKN